MQGENVKVSLSLYWYDLQQQCVDQVFVRMKRFENCRVTERNPNHADISFRCFIVKAFYSFDYVFHNFPTRIIFLFIRWNCINFEIDEPGGYRLKVRMAYVVENWALENLLN